MPINDKHAWLICYDIANPKRLRRFHRYVRSLAQPVQYSVFYIEGSRAQLGRLVKDLAGRINLKEDDLRVYPIPASLELYSLGRGQLPQDAQYHSEHYQGLVNLLSPKVMES